LKQLRCITIKIPTNCRQLVVPILGVTPNKNVIKKNIFFDEEGVKVFILKNC